MSEELLKNCLVMRPFWLNDLRESRHWGVRPIGRPIGDLSKAPEDRKMEQGHQSQFSTSTSLPGHQLTPVRALPNPPAIGDLLGVFRWI